MAPPGPKARQSSTKCKRMITIRTSSDLHTAIIRDAENRNLSHNTLLNDYLSLHYLEDITIMKSEQWKKAETFIRKVVSGIDVLSGKQVTGECYGVDCHVKPMGPRGIFLVVKGPTTVSNYKIDFSTFQPANEHK